MDRGDAGEGATSHPGYNVYTAVIDGRSYTFRRRRQREGLSYYHEPRSDPVPMLVIRPRWRPQPVADDENTSNKRARVAGATKAAVRGLPKVTPSKLLLQAECAVCLTDFEAEDKLRAMPCAHAFHKKCIFRWLRRKGSCPLCRHPLSPPPPPPTHDNDHNQETARSPAAAQTEDTLLSSATRQDD